MIVNKQFDKLDSAINYIYEEASNYSIDGVKNNIGGPFGAGIIEKLDNGYNVININRNEVIKNNDPTCHAEVNAIREVCTYKNSIFLENCILVTTAKSCPMCLSASIWAKIPVIYYSEGYEKATESDFKDDAISEYIKGNNNIIEEIQYKNNNCGKPFEVWNNMDEKTEY